MAHVELLNPTKFDTSRFDEETARQLHALISFFENRGKARLLADDLDAVWTADFLEFVAKEKLFATFCTPAAYADGNPNKRWDATKRSAQRDTWFLRSLVLVRLASHRPRPRSYLDE